MLPLMATRLDLTPLNSPDVALMVNRHPALGHGHSLEHTKEWAVIMCCYNKIFIWYSATSIIVCGASPHITI